jgi:hypothetical protein
MRTKASPGQRARGKVFGAEQAGRPSAARFARRRLLVVAVVLVAAAFGTFAASALATISINGSPLITSIGPLGECQSNFLNGGNNFYPGTGTQGDCGFFLAFPKAGNPEKLQSTVYGFSGIAGPHLTVSEGGVLYTSVKQEPPTGNGSAATPYTQVTIFKVSDSEEKDYVVITETTTYVNGQPQFTSTFDVQNITGPAKEGFKPAAKASLVFHAIYAGDLFTNNSDFGTGVFLGGPPPFIGGQNTTTGVLGGFIQTGPPSPPWTNYSTGCWNEVPESRCEPHSAADVGIWASVRKAANAETVFNNDVDPNLIDNAAAVSWDDHLTALNGLKSGEHAVYSIINRAQVPTALSVQPVEQTHTVGQAGSVTVTAIDSGGTPYANRPLVFSVGGANPKTGTAMTNGAGVATISYVGAGAGLDTIQMFLDLVGKGVQASQDPTATAKITWLPLPPTPDSSYKVQSIHANPDGTITIVFVPTQSGLASVEVTVPTGTISRKQALEAKRKKCKKGLIKIKGKCRPKTTVSGRVSASGVGGVPLTLTVKPSGKVKAALKKGRTVTLIATLTYKSALGGTPTVQVFHFTVKPPKKHKKH